jgi:hypothetical protein
VDLAAMVEHHHVDRLDPHLAVAGRHGQPKLERRLVAGDPQ